MFAQPFHANARAQFTLLCVVCLSGSFLAAEERSPASAPSRSLEEIKRTGASHSKYLEPTSRPAKTKTPKADLQTFRDVIAPILEESCVDCHGPGNEEGNIRVDTLDPNLLKGDDVDWWVEVLAVLSNGEMPPPDEVDMDDDDRSTVVEWLSGEIQVASTFRRATGGHSSFRRLTRYETNHALQDLLGLPYEFAKDLPPEAHSDDGFQNSSEMLHMTVKQLDTYRQLARQALDRAIVLGDRPAPVHWSISMKQNSQVDRHQQQSKLDQVAEKFKDDPDKQKQEVDALRATFQTTPRNTHYRNLTNGQKVSANWAYNGARYAMTSEDAPRVMPPTFDHVAVLPGGRNQKLIVELGDQLPNQGVMRVRVRASWLPEEDSSGESHPPSLQLEFGWRASNEGRADMRISGADQLVEASPDEPQIYEWDIPLGDIYPRNSVRGVSKMGSMPSPSEYIRFINSSVSKSAIQIDHVEVVAPVNDHWPPESHQQIFIASKHHDNEPLYAKEVLAAFMHRAWRRPPTEAELERKLKLFNAIRDQCESMEEAISEVLASILSSPNFLYVVRSAETNNSAETADRLSSNELTTRLALFLWCSVPDTELLELARDGQLSSAEQLSAQVNRMLADPKAERFSEHFVHQWLDLQLLDFLNVKETKPKLSPLLKEAMQREPIAFFHELLHENESVLQFIHADFAMVNERLARHYQIPNVHGNHFRRVSLNSDPRRGGLLTQAGLLAMNSDGTDSHPLKRGVWLLESILNDPPPPPPPAVPEIDLADPEIAKMTLIERMADHRNHPACMSCHSKIDPWGIAFENYDAVGRWRDSISGKPVVASATLFNQQELDGVEGLKRYLLEHRQDQFVRAMVHKLATYALGRPLTFSDHVHVDQITAEVRQRGDGLGTMIQQLVASDLFQSK
ncbi:DUF1592 domain-containing protein [Rhodopirellula bahusiensis]|uniref:Cytochrome c domain-containing protein n=1 Tax=Rhodopirellula bahusiensis TaxID=2014065 RepID=A0A2G1W4I8_9BACT|nr:DUF1592 domain-containing protein [Rhodopirellula bahusiensis]PHQ33579.1 hypothetical protein CEE69_20050 [Rhodopirellula bahusiensis]